MPEQSVEPESSKDFIIIVFQIMFFLVACLIGMAVFQLLGIFIAGVPLDKLDEFLKSNVKVQLILTIWSLVPVLGLTYFFRTMVDKKSFVSLGISLRGRGGDIVSGFIIALVILGSGAFILSQTGNIEFARSEMNINKTLIYFILFSVVAINEELIVRGYILNNLLSVTNKYLSLIISAVIFAVMHSLNSGLTWIAVLNLFLAGILLGSAYIFTQNLWFAISLHLFWNFIQGPVMGFNVSGQITESYFSTVSQGTSYLSGGEFGFEGSIICSFLCIGLALAIVIHHQQKSNKVKVNIQK